MSLAWPLAATRDGYLNRGEHTPRYVVDGASQEVARLPEGAADERGGVILVAHYDSKSQDVPLLWRMGLSAVVLLAGGCLVLLVLVRGALGPSRFRAGGAGACR